MDKEQEIKHNDVIDFKGIAKKYMRYWWVFAGSLVLCLGLAFIYIAKKSPIFVVHSTLMLNQDLDNQTMSGISALAMSFGISNTGDATANMQDEITRLTSQTLLSDVVRQNRLNYVNWTTTGLLKRKIYYWQDEPFTIQAPQQILDTISESTIFRIDVKKDGKFAIKVEQDDETVIDTEVSKMPYTARTPLATFRIDTTSFYKPGEELTFHSIVNSTPVIVAGMREELNVSEIDKKGNGIYVEMDGPNVPRMLATVNSINEMYNDRRFNQTLEKRRMSLEFIEGRLLNLYTELQSSEARIEAYKRENNIVDAQVEAEYIFARKGSIEATETETRTKLEIYRMIRDMLSSPKSADSLIPFTTTGSETESLPSAIQAYNELILKRMEVESTVKGQSANLERLKGQIDALRENILSTLSREIEATKIALSTVTKEQGVSDSRIKQIPSLEKELTQLYRDREVNNSIYAFLLQKREEAEIAVAQVKPYGEIVDEAYSDIEPVAPNKLICLIVGFTLGLILGAAVIQFFFSSTPESKEA